MDSDVHEWALTPGAARSSLGGMTTKLTAKPEKTKDQKDEKRFVVISDAPDDHYVWDRYEESYGPVFGSNQIVACHSIAEGLQALTGLSGPPKPERFVVADIDRLANISHALLFAPDSALNVMRDGEDLSDEAYRVMTEDLRRKVNKRLDFLKLVRSAAIDDAGEAVSEEVLIGEKKKRLMELNGLRQGVDERICRLDELRRRIEFLSETPEEVEIDLDSRLGDRISIGEEISSIEKEIVSLNARISNLSKNIRVIGHAIVLVTVADE